DARAAAGGSADVRSRAGSRPATRARPARAGRGRCRRSRSLVQPVTAAAAAARTDGQPVGNAARGAPTGAGAWQPAVAQHEPAAAHDGASALPAVAAPLSAAAAD